MNRISLKTWKYRVKLRNNNNNDLLFIKMLDKTIEEKKTFLITINLLFFSFSWVYIGLFTIKQ